MTEQIGSRVGRRAELRQRRRRQRRRLVIAGVTVFALLAVAVTVVLVRNGGTASKHNKTSVRVQRTLLFQVKALNGAAISSALMAHDPKSGSGSVVLIQPQVLANVPGVGSGDFGSALATGGISGSRNALSDLMGVIIDGSWVVDGTTFARLVDSVGGVNVNVDVTVLKGRTILLNSGQQRLSGGSALTFATYLAPGEQEQVRLTRLQAVLDAILNELPKDPTALIGSLGPGSKTSEPAKAVADLLTGLAKDDQSDNLQYQSLPVTKVDTGDDQTRFRIDPAADKQLVDTLLSQSIPPGARKSGNRVLVLNGVGTPGLGDKVRARLVPAGFVFIGSRNAPHFGFAQTIVLVPNATEQSVAVGRSVAKAIGVPGSAVQTTDEIGTIADVVVIVGADFKPK
ncbi:MAG: cell envelope-related transcriptional attenuator [Frankiales bacterium]|nr:cell envelope-related transcriptional attenuator [Frankiales bacterium]MCW2708143.1 cell envelope-related transcriptional attenuator [Frankiales bacterium]